MAARAFRDLVARLHPKRSYRELSTAAGLKPGYIGHYTRDSVPINRMPERQVLDELARALGCHPYLVIEALAEDVDLPWGPPLDDPDLAELVRVFLLYSPDRRREALSALAQYRLIDDPDDRHSALRTLRAFSGGRVHSFTDRTDVDVIPVVQRDPDVTPGGAESG